MDLILELDDDCIDAYVLGRGICFQI